MPDEWRERRNSEQDSQDGGIGDTGLFFPITSSLGVLQNILGAEGLGRGKRVKIEEHSRRDICRGASDKYTSDDALLSPFSAL